MATRRILVGALVLAGGAPLARAQPPAAGPGPLQGRRPAALVEAGRHEEARAAVEAILRQGPGTPADHLALARSLEETLRWKEALEALKRAVVLYPKHGGLRLTLARMLEKRTRFRSAFHEYEEAVALAPADSGLRLEVAGLYHRRGNLVDALPHTEALARLEPDVAAHHLALAGVLEALGRAEAAAQARGRAVRLDPALGARPGRSVAPPAPPPPGENPEERREEAELSSIMQSATATVGGHAPVVLAHRETLAAEHSQIRRLSAGPGTTLRIVADATQPIDALIVSDENIGNYRFILRRGTGSLAAIQSHAGVTHLETTFRFPDRRAYYLILDNSFFPKGGARSGVAVDVALSIEEVGEKGQPVQSRGILRVPYEAIMEYAYVRGQVGLTIAADARERIGGGHVSGQPLGAHGRMVVLKDAKVGP